MLKFIVAAYKLGDWTREPFREYFPKTPCVMAKQLPGLGQAVQNFVATNPKTIDWDCNHHRSGFSNDPLSIGVLSC